MFNATAIPVLQTEDVGEEYAIEEIGEDFLTEDIGKEFKTVDKEEDWHLVPDAYGKMHLVDINSVDMEAEPLFDAVNDVIFRLWTRANPGSAQIIPIYNDAALAASNFNPSLETRIHLHGWNAGLNSHTGSTVRSTLLIFGDFNVFTVDWGVGSNTANYVTARNRVNEVGQLIAQHIDWLNSHGVSYSAVTIIGHDLGAHIAGAAGKGTRGLVHAIVALNPAGPLFSLDNPEDRFHYTDAYYVESQVTDEGRLGFEYPVADAIFYPNWGTSQPGCEHALTGDCNHGLIESFFAASIDSSNVFGATRCQNLDNIRNRNCIVSGPSRRMGGEPVMDAPGTYGSVYFLETAANYPFALGPR